jgi:catechol 2,3-dioxygenase-like lactoylglutathione lyase family enzyme
MLSVHWFGAHFAANRSRHFAGLRFREGADMETIVSDLVDRFEQGSLSRRELVQGLAMLAAGGAASAHAAQADLDFKAATIDHVSVQVVDLQRSVAFYQRMFDFSVVSQEQPRGIVRLGNGRVLISLNNGSPAPRIDHFAIGIPRFTRDLGMRHFTQRGATPLEGDYAGFHIKDPDGINVQVSQT